MQIILALVLESKPRRGYFNYFKYMSLFKYDIYQQFKLIVWLLIVLIRCVNILYIKS